MKDLRKTKYLGVRLTRDQESKLARAAQIESQRRGENVDESVLARELMMAAIEAILAREKVEAA